MLTMSLKERDRLVALRQVEQGQLTVSEGAARLKLSRRHLRRVLHRFEQEGDAAVVHRARGRPPNNRKSERVRRRALERAQEPVFHDFGPTLLAEHLSRDPEVGPLSAHTLRRWLLEAGLWSRRRKRARHRRRRERRAALGELVQMDTSIHPWLEDRSAEEIVLIAMIDDATSRLFARFFPRDTGAANREMLIHYLHRHGRMRALYTDRASHFQAHWQASARQARDEEEALTVLRRGLEQAEADPLMPGSRLAIERRVDRSTHFRWKERYLNPTPLEVAPKAPPPPEPRPRKPPPPRPLPPDHPWRRFPIRVGRGRFHPHPTNDDHNHPQPPSGG